MSSSVQQQLANAQMMDAALSNVEQEQDEANVVDGTFHIYYVEGEAAGMFLRHACAAKKVKVVAHPLKVREGESEVLSQLEEIVAFLKLESQVAAAHGRNQVPKLLGRTAYLTLASPEEARRNCIVLHKLENAALAEFDAKLQKQPFLTGSTAGVCDFLLFWILLANFVARDAESELEKHNALFKWITSMKNDAIVSELISGSAMQKSQELFEKTATSDTSELDTTSPLALAISNLKYVASGLQLSRENHELISKIIDQLSNGKLMSPALMEQLSEGKVNIDRNTKGWMEAEMGRGEGKQMALKAHHSKHLSKVHATMDGTVSQNISIPENIQDAISTLSLDVLSIDKSHELGPLVIVGTACLTRENLLGKFFALGEEPKDGGGPMASRFSKFLALVEGLYEEKNPYHNAYHAADVTNSVSTFLSGEVGSSLSVLETVSTLLAAAIHDVGHTGHNNQYHVVTRSDLALLYNDQSVLEMYHLATGFRVLQDASANCLAHLSREDYGICRSLIIDLVLATDMSKHFSLVTQFNLGYEQQNKEEEKEFPLLLKLQCIIKTADIGHCAKPVDLHVKWSMAISEEFFRQGDEEREKGLPVAPHMDRQTACIPKGQIGFINFVVKPLYEICAKISPDTCNLAVENLEASLKHWKAEAEALN
eukprot:g293.t1